MPPSLRVWTTHQWCVATMTLARPVPYLCALGSGVTWHADPRSGGVLQPPGKVANTFSHGVLGRHMDNAPVVRCYENPAPHHTQRIKPKKATTGTVPVVVPVVGDFGVNQD